MVLYNMVATHAVDSKKLESEPGTSIAGCPSSLGFGVGAPSRSNLQAWITRKGLYENHSQVGSLDMGSFRRAPIKHL